MSEFTGAKRFLGDQTALYAQYIKAADEYPKLAVWDTPIKPFGNLGAYCDCMYRLLDVLYTLDLPPQSHILEVGAACGWITGILLGLNYRVDSIEPSEEFVKAAKLRVESFTRHINSSERAAHAKVMRGTIEEFDAPEGKYDAVLFFDVFHHVVDENAALAKCFKSLRNGGFICIQEGAWNPGNKELEKLLEQEMQTYGTLENPFTTEYLDYVLEKNGFDFIERHFGISRTFSFASSEKPGEHIHKKDHNFVIARKPWEYLTSRDKGAVVSGTANVPGCKIENGKLSIQLKIKNTGQALWLADPKIGAGYITVSLVNKHDRTEIGRKTLEAMLHPGDETQMLLSFDIPPTFKPENYCIDLINEQRFWFGLNAELGEQLAGD